MGPATDADRPLRGCSAQKRLQQLVSPLVRIFT